MRTLLLSFVAAIVFTNVYAQKSINYTVPTTVQINSNGHIELNFQMDEWGTTYTIYRMDKGAKDWGSPLNSMSGGDSSVWATYLDETAEEGKVYEYRIIKSGVGNFTGTGYIMTGNEIDAIHDRGVLLMFVESTLFDDAKSEINSHAMDLAGDGWNVDMKILDPSDNNVPNIRATIDQAIKDHGEIESIYLLGHIAVPYSGQYCNDRYYSVPPDGHGPGQGDHCGAWPADVYYAVHDATWTDNDSTTEDSRRDANKNLIGDGKFDQIEIPTDVNSQMGRVDLSDLPNFTQTEAELVKRYIAKNKKYRYVEDQVHYLGLVDENFNASIGAFASTAWRNFSSLIGKDKTEEKDFFTTLTDSTYILAYGTGGGSYTSCNGVGRSTDYVTKNTAIFNLLFGSFFGDWDVRNNFLRSALATEKGGLTNSWSGRPWWHLHPMGMGETMGYCTRLTQNQNQRWNDRRTYVSSVFGMNVHIALMGDPSLRMYMYKGAQNVTVNANSARDEVVVDWDASPAEGVLGYHVYYSWSPTGPYVKINHDILADTELTHIAPFDGDAYYMVRAERLETSPSGTFYNLSQGVIQKVDNLNALNIESVIAKSSIKIYPNPNSGVLNIELRKSDTNDLPYTIQNAQGLTVKREILSGSIGDNIYHISTSSLSNGVYFIHLGGITQRIVVLN